MSINTDLEIKEAMDELDGKEMTPIDDCTNSGPLQLKDARKLTASHFRGNSFSKMRVGRAAQVLSRTMASGVAYAAELLGTLR
jgi:hypothetical protein